MTSDDLEKLIDDDLKRTSSWLLGAFSLGWLAILVRFVGLGTGSSNQPKATEWLPLMCTGLLWTLAWLAGGFLFGFLFGVPKVITQERSQPGGSPTSQPSGSAPSTRLKVNTNLEDISDWLTKVLVGATLTQILKVPSAISRVATFMSDGVNGHVPFNAAILIYYSSLGFLTGYILTRMFFARAFALADEHPTPSLTAEAAGTLGAVPLELGRTEASVATDPTLKRAAIESAGVVLTDAISGSHALAIAKGAAVSGDVQRALKAAELAVQKMPDEPEARLTYAWSLRKLGANLSSILPVVEGAAQRVTASTEPTVKTSVYASLAYLYLYEPPPSGFEHALRALAEYDSKNGVPNSDIELNRACAFGQKYKYLLRATRPPGQQPTSDIASNALSQARLDALESVKEALQLDPTSISRFKELMWVTADPQDDDLAVFNEDEEFTDLIPRT